MHSKTLESQATYLPQDESGKEDLENSPVHMARQAEGSERFPQDEFHQ